MKIARTLTICRTLFPRPEAMMVIIVLGYTSGERVYNKDNRASPARKQARLSGISAFLPSGPIVLQRWQHSRLRSWVDAARGQGKARTAV